MTSTWKISRKLVVDGFNHLTNAIEKSPLFSRHLHFLIGARQGQELDTVMEEEFRRFFGADVRLVSQHFQVGVFTEHFETDFQVTEISRRQLEVEDQSAQGDQQMQLEAKNGLFFGRHFAKSRFKSPPIAGRTWHQIELHDWQGQAINDTLRIQGQIQVLKHDFADQIEPQHQVPPPTVEPALGRNVGKQSAVFPPMTQHLRFEMLTATFANQSHADQLAITAHWLRTRTIKQRSDLLPNVIHKNKNPQAEIRKVAYHWDSPPSFLGCGNFPIPRLRTYCQQA